MSTKRISFDLQEYKERGRPDLERPLSFGEILLRIRVFLGIVPGGGLSIFSGRGLEKRDWEREARRRRVAEASGIPTAKEVFTSFKRAFQKVMGRPYRVKPMDGGIFKQAQELGTFDGLKGSKLDGAFRSTMLRLKRNYHVSFRSVVNNLEEEQYADQEFNAALEDAKRMRYLREQTRQVVRSFEAAEEESPRPR